MALFKSRPRTAQQKAQRTQMRVLARVACCAYIVFYVVVPMLKEPAGDDSMQPAMRVGIAVAFIVAVAVIAAFTVREIVLNWKAGFFKAEAYTDDPEIGGGAVDEGSDDGAQSEGPVGIEDGDDEDDDGDVDGDVDGD